MEEKAVLEKLQDIFRDVFNDNELFIHENTTAKDIEGWDSLMHITILEAVQDEFEITFSLNEMISMKNIADMVSMIEKRK